MFLHRALLLLPFWSEIHRLLHLSGGRRWVYFGDRLESQTATDEALASLKTRETINHEQVNVHIVFFPKEKENKKVQPGNNGFNKQLSPLSDSFKGYFPPSDTPEVGVKC